MIKEHKDSGEKWTDPDFPPNEKSIGLSSGSRSQVTWKRIPDVIRNPEFISGRIEPADVLQGKIGNCYFLSSVAALAETDYRIKNLFPELKINPHGIYMARILHEGVLQEVVVDDYIPVTPQGTVLYAQPAGGR